MDQDFACSQERTFSVPDGQVHARISILAIIYCLAVLEVFLKRVMEIVGKGEDSVDAGYS